MDRASDLTPDTTWSMTKYLFTLLFILLDAPSCHPLSELPSIGLQVAEATSEQISPGGDG